jgi:hypothetical protein
MASCPYAQVLELPKPSAEASCMPVVLQSCPLPDIAAADTSMLGGQHQGMDC